MSLVAAQDEDLEAGKHMALSLLRFRLGCDDEYLSQSKEEIKAEILKAVTEKRMGPYYSSLCAEFGWPVDDKLLAGMRKENEEELKGLEEKQKDAVENLGDLDVLDAAFAKAKYFVRIGDKDGALAAYVEASEKALSTGQKLDVVLQVIRVALFHGDHVLAKEKLAEASKLAEAGGDWDRRNRLKVYEAFFFLLKRQVKEATANLLDSVVTFTSYELVSYERCIIMTVLMSLLTLDRVDLKKKVVTCPEIITVIRTEPVVQGFLTSFYQCNYKAFFQRLVDVHTLLKGDQYFAAHAHYYVREMRVKAYTQFLQSYKSVTMSSMAAIFGVSEDFVDRELSHFIASGRVTAKIDKTAGIIESDRPDKKNTSYQSVIKHGDGILNKIQKLARLTSV